MNAFPRLDFGILIAFFLPGFVSLYALSNMSSRVAEVFKAVLLKDQALGASFLILVASLVAGIVTSSFRELTLDWLHNKTGASIRQLNYSTLAAGKQLEVFREAINNTYRYYQFYGNTLIALMFLGVLRYVFAGFSVCQELVLFVVNIIAVLALFIRSRQARQSTDSILGQILDGEGYGEEEEEGCKEEDNQEKS